MFVNFFNHSDEAGVRRQVSSFKSYSYSSSSSHSSSGSRGGGYGAPAAPSSYSSASSHSFAAVPAASSYSGARAGSYGSNTARGPDTSNSYGSHGGYGGYGGGRAPIPHAGIPLAPMQRPSPRPYSSAGSLSSSESKKYGSLEMQSGSGSRESSSSRKVCTKKPLSVLNAKVKCTLIDNKCVAKCMSGYQFPTGETSMDVICEEGEWTLRRSEWNENLSCERE